MLSALLAAAALAGTPALDPQRLPALPVRGFARQERAGVVLESFQGRAYGLLRGFHFPNFPAAHELLLQDERARLFLLDRRGRRLRRISVQRSRYPGCRPADVTTGRRLLLCGRVVEVAASSPGRPPEREVVAQPRPGLGRWTWAEFSPNGKAILAQWSGECESPTAYLVANGGVRPYGGSITVESVGLGWLPGNRAVVSFWTGICGSAYPVPGLYLVPLRGKPERLRRYTGFAAPQLAMWGG